MSGAIQACKLKQRFRLHLAEISALCLRGKAELIAVGDEDFMIATAALRDDGLRYEHSKWVRHILPEEVRSGESGSEWEAIAADGKGRVFIVKESSLTVIVLSRSFRKYVHTIDLDVEDGPDEGAMQLLDDENAGPEGILLLEAGRLLVAKQKILPC